MSSTRSRTTTTSAIDKSMVSSPSSYSATPARRRISKACNYCRQRKIKCNGNSPCLNCKSHSIDCVYSKTIRKKKKQPVKKLTLQDLEKRLNKMDQKYDFLNSKLSEILKLLKSKDITSEGFNTSPVVPKKRGRKPKAAVKKEDVVDQVIPSYEADENDDFSYDEEEEYDEDEDVEDAEDRDDLKQGEEISDEDDGEEEYDDEDDDEDIEDQPIRDRSSLNNPISPVESNNSSSTNNDQSNWNSAMTPTDNFSLTSPLVNDQSTNKLAFDNNKAYSHQPVPQLQQIQYIDNRTPFDFNNSNLVNNVSLDIGNMENKLSMLYGEFPLITSQLENDLY